MYHDFPTDGFVRLSQILPNKRLGTPGFVPVSKSSWWAGVKSGRYPQPVKLGPRTTAWKAADIRALAERLSRGEAA
ncbi:helix-turn-helix transcriptional regulator [Desulfolutivibrio sulfoxidireducens]|uniref:helix-turn-helix transcriptional regulator n=1 Tax=Desulfolutivibrio sulfoxidireducens TaxID=2773299 RepID=UPI00159DD446|nr:AlpA family phage regulatory protein [Desulfolutivibrio sulfoxidireducens]QLA16374.1 AlpA family phage regulatory protein [Desulfolutivibrio sulfoxidireducens]